MDNTEKSPVVLSLCSGMRGLERGIEIALGHRLTVAAYVDIEAFVDYNLVAQMEKDMVASVPIWTDVKTFPANDFYKKIHGITAGYPCQPFSNSGNRDGCNDPRHLFPYIYDIKKSVRPIWSFFENVEGHTSLGFDEVYRMLHDLGYLVEAGIYSAEEVGASHKRKRLFILAWDMEYAESWRRGRMGNQSRAGKGYGVARSSELLQKLANGYDIGHIFRQDEKHTTKGREYAFFNSGSSGNSLAKSDSQGCEGDEQRGTFEEKLRASKSYQSATEFYSSLWPARPGEQQFKWEERRTAKSGLGVSVNGYNFKNDLLRMLGNGVVELTAAKAWVGLWDKMLDNIEKSIK